MSASNCSISTSLLVACARSNQRFTALSTHATACNFIGEQGTILAFVTPRYGNGPFHLVVPPVMLAQLKAQPRLQLRDNTITAGPITLHLHELPCWDAELPNLHQLSLDAFVLLDKHYRHVGQPALGFVTGDHNVPAKTTFHAPSVHYSLRVQRATTMLSQSLHEYNSDLITIATELLAGLGPGLTPAGDDFLVGLLAALYAFGPRSTKPRWAALQTYASQIATVAAPRTTKLSAAWLACAGAGAFGEKWHHLICALNGDNLSAVIASANGILATGATSGADALGGFLFGWQALLQENR